MKRRLLFFMLTAAFALLTSTAWAAAAAAANYGIDSTLDYVQKFATSGMMDTLLGYARSLFIGLATLSLALGLIRMLLNGEANVGTLFAHLTRWILYVGVFSWIMSDDNDFPQTIVNSFVEIGDKIGGTASIAPDNILSAGIRMYGTLVQRGWEAGWGDFIGVTLLGVIILVVIAMIAGLFALALVEMYLVVCGGAVLLGFGGFEYTRDIALGYVKYVISVGIKLLMVMILYGLATDSIPGWEESFSKATDMTTLITAAGQILGGVICIYMAVRYIPNMAQSVVNRASLSFGHPTTQVVYTSLTGAPDVTARSGGGFVGGLMDALRGRGRGAGAGGGGGSSTPDTGDYARNAVINSEDGYAPRGYVRGEEGMLSGAGYNPVAGNQAARHVQNPANAEAMTNYVPADTVAMPQRSMPGAGVTPGASAPLERMPGAGATPNTSVMTNRMSGAGTGNAVRPAVDINKGEGLR